MPVDLYSASSFARRGLVIHEGDLVILQSRGISSRVWRVPLDRLESVVVTRRPPWAHLTIVTLLILPGVLLLAVEPWLALIFVPFLFLLVWYAAVGQTELTFHYAQRQRGFWVITRRGKVERFLNRLNAAADAAQGVTQTRGTEPGPLGVDAPDPDAPPF